MMIVNKKNDQVRAYLFKIHLFIIYDFQLRIENMLKCVGHMRAISIKNWQNFIKFLFKSILI